MRIVETSHLKTWAGSKPAESRFPHLVKALILASIQAERLRMPSGDATWLPGYDGVLVSTDEHRFVPKGLSVWELGTGEDITGKANRDFEKRSKPSGSEEGNQSAEVLNRSDTTFVFVTPRVWKGKDEWVRERKEQGIWRDVVAIDGADLQDWLEATPAVHIQFAVELGIVPEEGLQSLDQAWDEWTHRTSPPLSDELVVVDRTEQEKALVDRLMASPSTFVIRGDSPREALGFALAAIRRAISNPDHQSIGARVIVADNETVARRLSNLKNHIILLQRASGQVSGNLESRGCHVIVPEGNDSRSEGNTIVLARPSNRNFAKALEQMGIQGDESAKLTRACGRSVTIFQRLRARANYERPSWADDSNSRLIVPALLAGRWSDRCDADRKILCQLADVHKYSEVESQLLDFLNVDEPPLQKIGDLWTLTAPVDSFQLMARRLNSDHLARFKAAFQTVFGQIDPKVELPPEDWILQDLKGERGHSVWLRSGLAETLLLISERGADAKLLCVSNLQAYVEDIARGLPGLSDDWRLLASLRDQFPLLMEGTPNPLLDSLEHLLEAKADDFRRIFVDAGMHGHSLHTGILWGLEVIAWGAEFLPRSALILAKLASIDPGGRVANRPISSLRGIFLWWLPGTCASNDQKLAVIDSILNRFPEVGWALLEQLMPSGPHLAIPTAKPRWRNFGDLPEDSRTRRGQLTYLSGIIYRALDHVGTDSARWRSIISLLKLMRNDQRNKALTLLESIARNCKEETVRYALWEQLRESISQHRTYGNSKSGTDGELLDRFESIAAQLAPKDLVERHLWLFDEWLPELPSGETDFDARKVQVERSRRQATEVIYEELGVAGLVRLGTNCKLPGQVATKAITVLKDTDQIFRLVETALSKGDPGIWLAGLVSGQAHALKIPDWDNRLKLAVQTANWSPEVVASLYLGWPDNRNTWALLAELGNEVEKAFWLRKAMFHVELPEEHAFVIENLIQVGRIGSAFQHARLFIEKIPTSILLRVFDAAFDALNDEQSNTGTERPELRPFEVRMYLDELRKRNDIDQIGLAKREYRALSLLRYSDASGLALHDVMAQDPDFFIEVICEVFLPRHRDKSQDSKPSSETQARGQLAYTLLQSMDRIPGQQGSDEINLKSLSDWIDKARAKATKLDRAEVTDEMIGQILAYSAEDPTDHAWPHRAIREAIEKLAAKDIDRGFIMGRHNQRGITSRRPEEGGDQERALANQYRDWANTVRPRWPRMARVLEGLAESYLAEAGREDTEAKQSEFE